MGTVEMTTTAAPPLEIVEENGSPTLRADGAISLDGTVVGTMVHGILDDDAVRASVLGELRRRRGWSRPVPGTSTRASRAAEYDRLADAIEANVDARVLWHLAKLDRRRAG